MVELLHANDQRVIIRLKDGMIVMIYDELHILKNIPERKSSEVKQVSWSDEILLNDTLRVINGNPFDEWAECDTDNCNGICEDCKPKVDESVK